MTIVTFDSVELNSTTCLDPDKVVEKESTIPSGSTESRVLSPESTEVDLNLVSAPDFQSDPLQLASMKKTDDELNSNKLPKNVQQFYKDQNELIDELTAPLKKPASQSDIRKKNILVKFAIYGSLSANMLLAALQLTASILSGSLVIFATMTDAFMDILSGGILIATNYFAGRQDVYKYPTGKNRFETVGIIVFGTLMSVLSLEVMFNAVKGLIRWTAPPDMDIYTILLIGAVISIKCCLYIFCKLVPDPSVRILAQDHRNDVLLNSTGLAFGLLASKLNLPFLDPVGAILISGFTFSTWTLTILQHCQLMAGKVAHPNFVKRVIYLTMAHDDRILYIETVLAYHSGSKVVVEVDIVLPPEMALKESHDLGESLQGKLESLEDVERAFVHCDYNCTHTPEHLK